MNISGESICQTWLLCWLLCICIFQLMHLVHWRVYEAVYSGMTEATSPPPIIRHCANKKVARAKTNKNGIVLCEHYDLLGTLFPVKKKVFFNSSESYLGKWAEPSGKFGKSSDWKIGFYLKARLEKACPSRKSQLFWIREHLSLYTLQRVAHLLPSEFSFKIGKKEHFRESGSFCQISLLCYDSTAEPVESKEHGPTLIWKGEFVKNQLVPSQLVSKSHGEIIAQLG